MNFILFFPHRFVDEFNKIYEYIIAMLFLWSVLSISSSLLVFLSQLVELNLITQIQYFQIKRFILFKFFGVGPIVFVQCESSWIDLYIDFDVHFVHCDFLLLWIWSNDTQSIRAIRHGTRPIRLVCISNWNAENVSQIYIVHTTFANYSWLWQYQMHSKCF